MGNQQEHSFKTPINITLWLVVTVSALEHHLGGIGIGEEFQQVQHNNCRGQKAQRIWSVLNNLIMKL